MLEAHLCKADITHGRDPLNTTQRPKKKWNRRKGVERRMKSSRLMRYKWEALEKQRWAEAGDGDGGHSRRAAPVTSTNDVKISAEGCELETEVT